MRVGFLGLLTACYAPQAKPGAPCDPAVGNCPSGQMCIAEAAGYFCGTHGSVNDAMGDGSSLDGLACGDLSSGLVGYWRFDEGTGTTADDSSATNNDGVITAGTWTTGKSGTALGFDGATSNVSMAKLPALEPTNAVSFGAWIKTPGVDQGFVLDRQKDQWTSYGIQIVGNGPSARPHCIIGYDAGVNSYEVGSSVGIGDNNWHLVTCTYDRVNLRLYVDGNLSTATPGTNPIYYDASAIPFYVGFHFEANTHFTGSIDEVRVYERALSGCEIQALANL